MSVIQAHTAILPEGELLQRVSREGPVLTFVVRKPSSGMMILKGLQLSTRRLMFNLGVGFGEFHNNTIKIGDSKVDSQAIMLAKNASARAGRVVLAKVLFDGSKDDEFHSASYGLICGMRGTLSVKGFVLVLSYERTGSTRQAA